ncbi:YcfA-like protein [Candidatus Competibacter denitrificans Run_A_D11]|uniref:YcfA-like protein n=1 Tax=Candidatus Competibacter denitrificans Run_A_D11 TaxID=1400863 RepID=W6M3B1_9GAMM|nr:YcfA-like protein [Candidatus Competibacter denitrificans Run_A_D11]
MKRFTLLNWRLRLVKLRVLSGREVCAILARHGFIEMRQRGSHIAMQKQLEDATITVPVPNHSEIRIGTLQSIIRQSGIPKSEFEA